MKIVINAISLLSQKTGVGRYVYELFTKLLELDNINEYNFFYGKAFSKRPIDGPQGAATLIKEILKTIPGGRQRVSQLIFDSYFWFKGFIEDYDIYHEPNFIPFNFRGKIVTSVCDLSFLLFPETHPKERIDHFNRHFYKRISWAERIITFSNYIKNEVAEHLGVPSWKIRSIPLAADERFRILDKNEVNIYLKGMGYPTDYILYAGAIEPRKNLQLLIKAFNNIRKEFNGRYFLFIAGPKNRLYGANLELIENLGIKERVLFLGYVPDKDLPYLYNGAKLFAFPSIYEGFGLPPLEAMACGVPVVCSNSSSLPEVLGSAAIMVNPYREDELTEAIHLILKDENLQIEMRQRGLNRVKIFSWEKCARETLQVYKELNGGSE